MKAKRSKKLLILAAIVVAFLVAGGTLFIVRKEIQQRKLIAARNLGLAAFAQGRYSEACEQLAIYLRPLGNRKDQDVIYDFALSHHLEAKSGAEGTREHLELAKNWFQIHVALKPDSIESWKRLLDIYPRLGRLTEALEVADRVLALEPANSKALQIRIECQTLMGRSKDALKSAEKLAELMPDDVENTVRRLSLLKTNNQTAEILPIASKLYAAKPDWAASELIMSIAYSLMDEFTPQQRAEAWALAEKIDPDGLIRKLREPKPASESYGRTAAAILFARKAAERPLACLLTSSTTSRPAVQPTSQPAERIQADFIIARFLISQFEQLYQFADAIMMLKRVAPTIDDPWVRGSLVLRLWESNEFLEVNKRLADFSVKRNAPEEIELLAVRAMSLVKTGKKDEAAAIVNQLAQFKDDPLAVAWENILRFQYLGGPGELPKFLDTVKAAINARKDRPNPYLWAALGEAYATMGEREAIQAFTHARDGARAWYLPHMRLSRLFVEAEQVSEAIREAEAARMVLPCQPTIGNYLVVSAAKTADGAVLDPLIARQVIEFQKQVPGDEQTLPLYLNVLVQAGKKDEAKKVLSNALAKEITLPAASILGLAMVSRNAGLGLEKDCIDVAVKKYGITPDIALMQASMLGPTGKTADALALYQQAREKFAKPETQVSWRLGWARLLQAARDPDAAKAWAELGDDPALKSNLQIQKAVLGAATVLAERALIDRTIERVKAITGDDVSSWRVARARLLMQEGTPAAITEARKLLEETIRRVPTSAEAHLGMGLLLDGQGDIDGAIKSLTESARLHANPSIVLEIARLYSQRSDFPKARELLGGLALELLDATLKAKVAMAYVTLGDVTQATAIVAGLPDNTADPVEGLFRVQLDRRNGNIEKAESRLRELLKTPSLAIVAAAADFYAATGRMDQAKATLELLRDVKLRPGERELAEAEFLDRYAGPRAGDTEAEAKARVEAVTAKYASAAREMPTDPRAQVAYISNLLHLGRHIDALAAGVKASAGIPSYLPLKNFLAQKEALNVLGNRPDALALAEAILRGHIDSAVAAEALDVLVKYRKEPQAQLVGRLRLLADRAPRLPALQLMVVYDYRSLGQFSEAASIASRTARANPTAVDAARLAAQSHADAGEWNEVIAASQTWGKLAPADSLNADLLCAEAYVHLASYPAALKQIAPHLAANNPRPEARAAATRMQLRILVASGDYPRAAEIIKPLLKEPLSQGQAWRAYDLSLVAGLVRDPDVVAKWLKELAQAIPADQLEEQVGIASVWVDKGVKFKRDDLRAVGRGMVKKLLDAYPEKLVVVYGAAMISSTDEDRQGAEAGYRKTLALDPKHVIAMNNLAMIFAEDNRSLDEAVALMNKAIGLQPNAPPFFDTLAFVEAKRKDKPAAMAAIQKAIDLEPANPKWRMRKVELLFDFGDRQAAELAIGEMDQLNKKSFSDETVEALQALRKKVSGTSATLPATR